MDNNQDGWAKRFGLTACAAGEIEKAIPAAALGVAVACATGLSAGGALILATLAASASYIAAPAAVRLALPEASPGLYLTCSLAITFPFNLVVGIPLYGVMVAAVY